MNKLNDNLRIKTDNLNRLHEIAEFVTFLALAYEKEISTSFFDIINESLPSLRLSLDKFEDQDLATGLDLLEKFFIVAKAANDREHILEELAIEYANLFLGVGINPVPVIESVYLGKEKTLYETPYFQVVDYYRKWNYEKPKTFLEPEDHLASELDFIATQLRAAAWAKDMGNLAEMNERLEAARNFKQDHLDKWITKACDDLLQVTINPFYRALAFLTRSLVRIC